MLYFTNHTEILKDDEYHDNHKLVYTELFLCTRQKKQIKKWITDLLCDQNGAISF